MIRCDPVRRAVAFLAAGLLVFWTCGSFVVAAFKLGWYLVYGTWPDTRLYGILPDFLIFNVATGRSQDLLATVWRFVMHCDVLHLLLVVPPVLLLGCLLPLGLGQGGMAPAWHRAARPFGPPAPGRSPPARPGRPGLTPQSRQNGTLTARRSHLP
jgi:hypothetical protein